MNGQKGLAIAITALLLTVCIGYLFNAEETTATTTVYNDQADMGAIFYENSSRVSGTEVYNPVSNVTGWLPNTGVSTTSTPSQYILTQGTVNYGDDATLTKTMDNSGLSYTRTIQIYQGSTYYTTNTDALYYGGETLNNGESLHGGISYIYGNNKLTYQLNGVTTDNGDYLLFARANEIMAFANQDYLYLNNGTDYYLDGEYSVSGAIGSGGITVNFTGTQVSDQHHAIYNLATERWNLYDDQDNKVGTANNIYIVNTSPSDSFTIKYKQFTGSTNTTYADPTKLVGFANGTSLSWNSGNLEYSAVSMLLTSPESGEYITISAKYPIGDNTTQVSSAGVLYNRGGVLMFDNAYATNPNITIGSASAYAGVLLKFDFTTHVITVTGVLSFDSKAPRTNYTLAENSFTRTMNEYGLDKDDVYGFNFMTNKSTTAVNVAIVETEIYTDPQGILWNNFNVDISDYFPQYINGDNLGVRVQLGGFVSYGDSITVNGQTFAVTDGTINVDITDSVTVQNRDMRLSGMAIDYRSDGHTYLVFTESLNRESDLGETSDYVISGAGTWYMSATFDTIEETTTNVWNWVTDWSLDQSATCLVYLGLTVLGLIIGLYYGRGTFGLYDWVVLILADVVAFSLMVI